jgi:flavorubredoxin
MLPSIAAFLEFLKGLKPRNRIAAAFGSYGWAGGAVSSIEKVLKEAGIETVQEPISVKFVPDENEEKRCHEFGVEFGKRCV